MCVCVCVCAPAAEGDVQSSQHSVFEYLQEVYCFESDTYVCAGFDDPSKDTKSRGRLAAAAAAEAQSKASSSA